MKTKRTIIGFGITVIAVFTILIYLTLTTNTSPDPIIISTPEITSTNN